MSTHFHPLMTLPFVFHTIALSAHNYYTYGSAPCKIIFDLVVNESMMRSLATQRDVITPPEMQKPHEE